MVGDNMVKLLITGSCGFLLSNFIIYALQETDWDLVSIDKLTSGSLRNVPQVKRHKLYVGDICDQHFVGKVLQVERPSIIIHGAAENVAANSQAFLQTNVMGTHNLLDLALKTKIKKFINLSTDQVYGNLQNGSASEASPLNPRNPYAASKASADLLGQTYFHTYGLPVLTARLSNNFGPRQSIDKLIPKVINNSASNQNIPLFESGANRREWTYVKDSFYALKTLIEKGMPGEVYNISSGHELDNLSVVKAILKLAGKDEELIEYVKDRPAHDFRYSVDCTKLKALGWNPQYQFDEALEHSYKWFQANKWFFKEGQ
jgi:dTDP-glucose 4,6-dehydratase